MNYYYSQIQKVIERQAEKPDIPSTTIHIKGDGVQTKHLNITLEKLKALQAIMDIGEND